MSPIDAAQWAVVIATFISVLIADWYMFKVVRKVFAQLDATEKTRQGIDERIDRIEDAFIETKEEIDITIKAAQEYLNPMTLSGLGEMVVIKSLESLGMQNLKELGEKGRAISNAKIGLQVIGNEMAKGLGINEVLMKYSPIIEKAQAGGDLLGQFQDNPLIQLGLQLFGKTEGVSTRVTSSASGVVQELKK